MDEHNEVAEIVGAERDFTARKQVEEALRRRFRYERWSPISQLMLLRLMTSPDFYKPV